MTGLDPCGCEFAALCLVLALSLITIHQQGWSLAWRAGGREGKSEDKLEPTDTMLSVSSHH